MSVFFISDIHFGNKKVAEKYGFKDTEEYALEVVRRINKTVSKRDKLFILGDLADTKSGLQFMTLINCRTIELIFGNHDKFPLQEYLRYVSKVHGFYKYKDLWLSHCPVHPQELYRVQGNIHGHIHTGMATRQLEDQRYYNVNVDFHDLTPVSFVKIQEHYNSLGR